MGTVSEARKSKEEAAQEPNYYCLNSAHSPELVTTERFFYSPVQDQAPTCDRCRDPQTGEFKQVSAAPLERNAEGQLVIPAALLALGSRLG